MARQAALEVFALDGYEATSLAAISLKAGFSRTLTQYHRPVKSALALELIEERLPRDNHVELLRCPENATGETAWAALTSYFEEVTRNNGFLQGSTQRCVISSGQWRSTERL